MCDPKITHYTLQITMKSTDNDYYKIVLSGIRNLKSVRFFNLVLRYDYSIVVTGNLAFTMLPTLMLKCSKSIRSSIVIRNGVG